jgi:hypothetical protein
MSLFRVTMTGRGLQLRGESAAPVDAGFVKNEFVLVESATEASKRAVEQVHAQLRQQAAAGGLLLKSISIEIDQVARSIKFWKLVQQEGFVFFPEESQSSRRTETLH